MTGKKPPLHETIEKERQVLELRLAHHRWNDIASAVGYQSAGAAYNAYRRALTRTLQEPAEEVRTQERERLDRIANALYRRALNGDLPAIDRLLRVMEQRQKLLGLQVTQVKHDVTINEGGSEFDERVRELAYLVAQNRTDPNGLDGGITPILDGTGATESSATGDGLADMANLVGSRLGQDEDGSGMGSERSNTPAQDTMGGSSEDIR